jgi:tetratricopeptide (TPR) repeat protein
VVHATEFPVASAADGMQRGDEAWRQGKLDLAVYLYVQSLAFDATKPEPFLRIGRIHEQLGHPDLAAKAYAYALERGPDDAAAWERLGLLHMQAGRNEPAELALQRAIDLEPTRVAALNGLGVLADRRGDHVAALARYDAALALSPKSGAVLANRGRSQLLAGNLAEARRNLTGAVAAGAGPEAWQTLGRVEAAEGRYAAALECFLHQADRGGAYNQLGEAALRNGDVARAKDYFEAAIEASPRYFEAAQRNLSIVKERLAASSEVQRALP